METPKPKSSNDRVPFGRSYVYHSYDGVFNYEIKIKLAELFNLPPKRVGEMYPGPTLTRWSVHAPGQAPRGQDLLACSVPRGERSMLLFTRIRIAGKQTKVCVIVKDNGNDEPMGVHIVSTLGAPNDFYDNTLFEYVYGGSEPVATVIDCLWYCGQSLARDTLTSRLVCANLGAISLLYAQERNRQQKTDVPPFDINTTMYQNFWGVPNNLPQTHMLIIAPSLTPNRKYSY